MANVRARIELRGCLTHTYRGRTVERGQPFYTTNPADIAYFKAQSEFAVTILADKKPARKPAPKPPKKETPPPATTSQEDSEEGESEEGGEDGSDEESEDLSAASYTKSDLEKMNKADLAKLAEDDFKLKLDINNLSKPKMVAAILKTQIEALKEQQ